jgi:osmotically-inducible protein OsmY
MTMATLASATMKSDDAIRRDVIREIEWEPALSHCDIGIAVNGGVVTLTGCQACGQSSRPNGPPNRVFGVRAVANDIGLNLTPKRTDREIARDVVQKLENPILIPSDKIKVAVRDGWMMLEGEVRWQFPRKLAESAVRGTDGMAGFSHTMTIKSNASPTKAIDQNEAALRRSHELDARRITVEVEGNRVILGGTARSWSEKEAERAACSAPGVPSVANLIEVVS